MYHVFIFCNLGTSATCPAMLSAKAKKNISGATSFTGSGMKRLSLQHDPASSSQEWPWVHELYIGSYVNKTAVNVSVCFETL